MKTSRRAVLACVLALAACAGGRAAATPEVRVDRVLVSSPNASPLGVALFMAGCWRTTEADGAVVEESWSLPAGGLMLGWSRTLRAGRPAQFEQLRIQVVDGAILFRPSPNAQPSEHDFRLTESAPGALTFEAPEHDFPRRIQYRRLADGALGARIDGGAGSDQSAEWRYESVDCP
jgi:hypothetical protein